MAKVSKAMAKSTEVMQIMNKLVNIPQINKTMRGMAMEMEKAGFENKTFFQFYLFSKKKKGSLKR